MKFEIRPVSIDELGAFVEVHNAFRHEQIVSESQLRRDDETFRPDQREHRRLAWMNDRPAGFSSVQRQIGGEEGNWFLAIGVFEPFRGQGLGTRLYDLAMEIVGQSSWLKVSTQVREHDLDSLAFARAKGFAEQKRDFPSVIDLQETVIDPVRAEGIDLVPFSALDSAEFRRAFHELFEEVRQDVPRSSPPVRFEFEEFERIVLTDPALMRDGTLVALEGGRPVGFSGIFDEGRAGWVGQWLTGVRRSHRRRGIARALKTHQLAWLKANGYRWVQTDNDSRNTTMLAINEQLGFVRQPALISMAKHYQS